VDTDFEQSPHTTTDPGAPVASLDDANRVVEHLRARMRRAVRGRDDVIDAVIIALLADGHVLLEDFPGSGKTTLAKALGDALIDDRPEDRIVSLRRIQFTPDLLPQDITGTTIFDPNTNRFYFRPGPIFAHIVLADEINRTSPKVQAALLEAMGEKQTTIDNRTRALDELFFVIATQNPLDLAGTFPLPAAQLDRFLFKIRMDHIDRASELDVLRSMRERSAPAPDTMPRVTRSQILGARAQLDAQVHVAPEILECLVDIAAETRRDDRVLLGASTRSLVLAVPALQARALTRGRDVVIGDDVAALAPWVFAHRIELAPGLDGPETVIADCVARPLETLARGTLRR